MTNETALERRLRLGHELSDQLAEFVLDEVESYGSPGYDVYAVDPQLVLRHRHSGELYSVVVEITVAPWKETA